MASRRPEAVTAPCSTLSVPNLTGALMAGAALCSHSFFLLATAGFNTVTVTGS